MKLSPQMFQSIQLMALPVQELKAKIEAEVENNPALEAVEHNNNLSLEDFTKKTSEEENYFENSSDPGDFSDNSSERSDSKRMFLEGALSRPQSLQDHLLEQLLVQPVSSAILEIGKLLIHNLDENGFYREEPAILAKGFSSKDIENAVKLIQLLDPQGTCTKDYKESLIIQAQLSGCAPAHTIKIIETSFDLLEKGKYKEISKNLKISERSVTTALDFIKSLNPFPGRQFSTETAQYVIPDLLIKFEGNELIIKLNEEEIPVLEISPDFISLQKDSRSTGDKTASRFVNTKIKEAQWFIRTVALRNQTLLKTAKAIAVFQNEFFLKGPKYLVPLTLKEIAQEVGVHETTISRISNSKYVQTDWGIFELKYFFSTSMPKTDSSESVSRKSVKYILKEIIEAEGKEKQFSDQNLADILKEKKGIQIARRTVAKYRKELDIASSYER